METHGQWLGRLELQFEHTQGQTILARSLHQGPLRVQRPFREPSGGCQLYVLNPPGGTVGGDDLQIDAQLGVGSRVLLTAPGATKFYRNTHLARISQHFDVAPQAHLEWLPQETIVYDGAHCELNTQVRLAAGASFAGWEITCLGRAAANETFTRGEFCQRFELREAGKLQWAERAAFKAGEPVMSAAWGLAGRSVFGSFVLHPVSPAALLTARAALHADNAATLEDAGAQAEDRSVQQRDARADWLAATQPGRTLVCRYLGSSSARARAAFCRVWTALRPSEFGCAAVPPRIWNT